MVIVLIFRAVSYCLTCSENHHHAVRSAICNHILENEDKFQAFLRSNESLVKSHVSLMEKDGNWATELEILGLAHMLSVNIFTFSNGSWLKFSGQNISASFRPKQDGLYLNHMNENHYDVVLEVSELLVNDRDNMEKDLEKIRKEENSKQTIHIAKGKQNLQYKREMFRKKYRENVDFRNEKLRKTLQRYKEDDEFRMSVKDKKKKRYQNDPEFRYTTRPRSMVRSREQYKDNAHKEKVLKKASVKYKTDTEHREKIKEKGIIRYNTDTVHRAACKRKSSDKYKTCQNKKYTKVQN